MRQSRSHQSSPAYPNGVSARPPSRRWRLCFWGGLLLVVVALLALDAAGASAAARVCWFLEFYSGVFSLVALSITVMLGLAATDRIVLAVRHRVLLQTAHRTVAVSVMACLGIHLIMKVDEGHARVVDAVVPFLATHRVLYVGFGTLAGYLVVVAMWTGLARGRFASGNRPGAWRLLHVVAYASWLLALAHGLLSGRPARPWVTVSYAACLVLVGLALLVRLSVEVNRRGHRLRVRRVDPDPAGRPRYAVEPVATGSAPVTATVADRETPVSAPADAGPSTPARPSWSEPAPFEASRPLDQIPDDEFWAYMRGEALR